MEGFLVRSLTPRSQLFHACPTLDPHLVLRIEFASTSLADSAAAFLHNVGLVPDPLPDAPRPALLLSTSCGKLHALPETALLPFPSLTRMMAAVAKTSLAPPEWALPDRRLRLDRPHIMGIVNVTPDSFYDAGRFRDPDDAIPHAFQLIDDGADILDVGGQSSRPGSLPVSATEELDRVLPVVRAVTRRSGVPVSIDTYRPDVATACADEGAHIVNDIRGLRGDPALLDVIAERCLGAVIMHMRGSPETMQSDIHYEDLIGDILWFLAGSVRLAHDNGIPSTALSIDPGIGFGKTVQDNLLITRRLHEFTSLGIPVTFGASRKSFIGKTLNRPVDDRLSGTHATTALAVAAGALIIRVHDVRQAVDVAAMTAAVTAADQPFQET